MVTNNKNSQSQKYIFFKCIKCQLGSSQLKPRSLSSGPVAPQDEPPLTATHAFSLHPISICILQYCIVVTYFSVYNSKLSTRWLGLWETPFFPPPRRAQFSLDAATFLLPGKIPRKEGEPTVHSEVILRLIWAELGLRYRRLKCIVSNTIIALFLMRISTTKSVSLLVRIGYC